MIFFLIFCLNNFVLYTLAMNESIDETAVQAVDKLLKARKITNPLFVSWIDKVNRSDKKILKRVLIVVINNSY